MLDESILGPEDVKKAATLGCASYVKFKLMKAGSRRKLSALIALANSLGLKVVLGNGVAGEIGCYHEAIAALEAGVEAAGEMNGFLKVRRRLLLEPLTARQGGIEVTPGLEPNPSPSRLAEMSVDQRQWC
jgi:L-alanine-DL-glutamate epimerase-like enolase superfamily enzyme